MRLRDVFYCLMIKNVRLRIDLMRLLLKESRIMAVEQEGRRFFLTEDASGVITTSFKNQTLGGLSGIQFDAEVESPQGKGHVRFLVHEKKLADQSLDLDTMPYITF